MRTLTLRGLAAHKRRLFSTMLAVLLGVAFMAGSLIFTDTMRASLSGVYQDASATRTPSSADPRPSRPATACSTHRSTDR